MSPFKSLTGHADAAAVGQGWSRMSKRLNERWERRADDVRIEAMHERTRASVASNTARVQVETAIELPYSAEQAWSLLIESGDESPLHVPGRHEIPLPGPGEGQVGHRHTHLTDSFSAGPVWRLVEREPGVVQRSECESTPGVWAACRFEPLAADRCRLTLAEGFGSPQGSRDAWEQALQAAHRVRLGKAFAALTGSAPPSPFAEAMASEEPFPSSLQCRPTVSDEMLVGVRVTESVDLRATASQVWELVRDLARVGLPDVHDDGRYVLAGPGGAPHDEIWVGLRPSALGTPLAVAVSMVDEVPGRRFIARTVGRGAATTTVEVVPTAQGCSLTVHRDATFREADVEIVRGRWQRAMSRYVREVAHTAASLG